MPETVYFVEDKGPMEISAKVAKLRRETEHDFRDSLLVVKLGELARVYRSANGLSPSIHVGSISDREKISPEILARISQYGLLFYNDPEVASRVEAELNEKVEYLTFASGDFF